jgi:CBS domain-containing protein
MTMIVSDLMTKNPGFVITDDALSAAVQIMWDADCGAVPVVDDADKLIGIVTDRDICIATWSRGLAPNAIFVGEAMTQDPARCGPRDPISQAAEIMRSKQIRRLPVVDSEQRLVGILSLADIVRVTSDSSARDRDISTHGLASTMAGICSRPWASTGQVAAFV